jgi:hypothetical protein
MGLKKRSGIEPMKTWHASEPVALPRRGTGADGALSNNLRIIRSFAMIIEDFF